MEGTTMKKSLNTVWMGLGLSLFFVAFAANAQDSNGMQLEVKQALVEPYMEQIEIKNTINDLRSEKPTYMKVWIMADDRKGSKIYFNQDTKKFGLARYAQGESPFTSDAFIESNKLTQAFLTRK
jgi:hypothetical protein